MSRQERIIKTSIIGIAVNLILVAFKVFVGIMTNSIAITMDAVNNLTDALSSIITIIGAKLAHRPPNKSHPYGYGRIEYFSSIVIAEIILLAGITALMESWPKIFTPDVTNYDTVSLAIVTVAIVVKLALGYYVKHVGEDINSQALIASGSDALFDSVLSLSTLAAALISIFFHISLEGILGVIIAIVIIKASIDMIRETIDSVIGSRADSELSTKIKASINEFPEVYGAYDLDLHNYGPEEIQGSVHIEIDDSLTALDIQNLTRRISMKIYAEFSVKLTVGIYAINNRFSDIRNDVYEIASGYEEVIEIHAFIVYEAEKLITFDLIVDFDADREEVKSKMLKEITRKHPEFKYCIIDDYDVSD